MSFAENLAFSLNPEPVCGKIAQLHIVFNQIRTVDMNVLWLLPMNAQPPYIYMIIASPNADFLTTYGLSASNFTTVIKGFIHTPNSNTSESAKAFVYVNNMPANPMNTFNVQMWVPSNIFNNLEVALAIIKTATPS